MSQGESDAPPIGGLDDPALLDVDDFVAALHEHRSSGSFGPLVTLEAETVDGSAFAAQRGAVPATQGVRP